MALEESNGWNNKIAMTTASWESKVALTFVPTIVYGILLFDCKFPQSERVQAGVSYREMLSDFGGLGAFISVFLISIQIFSIVKPEGWTPLDNAIYALIPGVAIAGAAFDFQIISWATCIFHPMLADDPTRHYRVGHRQLER